VNSRNQGQELETVTRVFFELNENNFTF